MVTALCGALPARAADPQLLNLVMPDAKVLAGVNVDQAKTSPFGQYVLNQMQPDNQLKELSTLTGFDPTRDVHEILVATSSLGGTRQAGGLIAARGDFDPSRISSLALSKGATSETYGGVTIIEDPKQQHGFAFLSPTIAIAGDLANVKAAIDRQTKAAPLAAAAAVQVNTWSTTQDAWVVVTVPPSTLHPSTGMPAIPGVGQQGQNNAFQNIQSAAGGVKFGNQVVLTGFAQAATAQDASQMGDAIKLLASLAQMQSNQDPNLTALTQSLKVSANGAALNVSLSMPQDTLVQILKNGGPHSRPAARPAHKKQ